ncbi:MAG: LysM peptidoglycan-binding domain-containing protein [Deltaproteobacteria bacterium]|nr:LysM peptidoglycan-binding domain-containing protein [Deltaproteobacteria bacterium]
MRTLKQVELRWAGSPWCAALLAGALALSASPAARAQEEGDPEGVTDLDAQEGETVEGQPAPAAGQPAAGEAEPQVAETHTVSGGDTLWDLCTKYLNSPWYWPKIWSYNPQITNPHWIYPGNELRFYPSDESLPTNVEVSRAMEVAEEEPSSTLDPSEAVSASSAVRVGRIPQNSVYTVHYGFIEAGDYQKAATIDNAFTDRTLMSPYEKIYAKFETAPKVGDRYGIYRTLKQIEHPVTGEPYGYVVEIIGQVEIVETSQQVASAHIIKSYRAVERGSWLGPLADTNQRVAPTPNTANAKGYIIETMESGLGMIGEFHLVFIDRGREQGVQVGNVFTILHRGDTYTGDVEGLPNEDVGKLMVIDVRANASTAMVIRAVTELSVGDKIEMRSGDS